MSAGFTSAKDVNQTLDENEMTGRDFKTTLGPPNGAPTAKSLNSFLSTSMLSFESENPNPIFIGSFSFCASLF